MPLYDFRCEGCGKEFEYLCKIEEMEGVECSDCGGSCKALISHTSKNRDWFRPHWNPNFDLDPVWVETKGKFKELCRRHNVTSRALGDVRNLSEV